MALATSSRQIQKKLLRVRTPRKMTSALCIKSLWCIARSAKLVIFLEDIHRVSRAGKGAILHLERVCDACASVAAANIGRMSSGHG